MTYLYHFTRTTLLVSALVTLKHTAVMATPPYLIDAKTLQLVTEVNAASVNPLISAIELSDAKSMTLYLNSGGGSILDGIRLIESMNNSNKTFTCLIDNAASMAFVITQLGCNRRVVSPYGVLYQHAWSMGLAPSSLETAEDTVRTTRLIFDDLRDREAKRLGITRSELLDKSNATWTLRGVDAVTNRAADEVSPIRCSADVKKMVTERTDTTPYGEVKVRRYVCPYITTIPPENK